MGKAQAIRIKKAHRSIGIVLVFFLLILAVTGIVLNHSDDIGLADAPVPAFIAGWYYDDELVAVDGFLAGDHYVYGVGADVYMDDQAVTACADDLAGAISLDNQLVALCGGDLLVVSMEGQLIERLGVAHGVPSMIDRLGRSEDKLVVNGDDGSAVFDLTSLQTGPVGGDIQWQQPAPLPPGLTRNLLADAVSWEKFIMDIHSGRIVGIGGVWLADLVAVLLVVMSVSGLVLGRFPYRKESGPPPE